MVKQVNTLQTQIQKIRHTGHSRSAFNQLYIQYKRPTIVYLKHIEKILDKQIKTIILHGMEASIPKVIDIALKVKQSNPDLLEKITTDFVETVVIKDGKKQVREVAAIHIVLKKQLYF